MSDFKAEYKALRLPRAWRKRYAALIGTPPSSDDELERIRALRAKVQAGLVWDEQGEEVLINVTGDARPGGKAKP